MTQTMDNLSPTVHDISESIRNTISSTIEDIESKESIKIELSYSVGTSSNDAWSFSISMALYNEPLNDKTLNFLVIQDIKTRDICVIITTGEKEGLRILYRSINKYPISGIEKYLPSIISSSVVLIRNASNIK